MKAVFDVDNVPWLNVGAGTPAKGYEYKQLISSDYTDAFSCELVKLPPGARSQPHIDTSSHALFCMDGEGEVTIGETTSPVRRGTLALVKRGEKHSLRNLGTGDMMLLVIYDPPFKWKSKE